MGRRYRSVHPAVQSQQPGEHKVLFLPRIGGIVTWSTDGVLRRWGLGGDLEEEIPEVRLPISLSETGLELAAMAPGQFCPSN